MKNSEEILLKLSELLLFIFKDLFKTKPYKDDDNIYFFYMDIDNSICRIKPKISNYIDCLK